MYKELKTFILLWLTQSLSALGSAMTSFVLIIWVYKQQGSALDSALLSICTYAPYVILSIFAGSLSDKWNKKITMLVCDSVAAVCTVFIVILMHTGMLEIWHLYLINSINGLMNTIQQPSSELATTLLVPKKYYQKVSGMRSFTNSLNTIMTPIIATAIMAFVGINAVIIIDLCTFALAFISLAGFIKIPESVIQNDKKETILQAAKSGLGFMKKNRGILELILFLAAINFIASIYQSALPAMLLSRNGGSDFALGAENACAGIANILGSIFVTFSKAPKSRVRMICNTLLFSMGTENFLLAFGNNVPIWCLGGFLGWVVIPVMGANLDVLLRSNIPVHLQGRVYSVRNSLQFFTIPIGYFLGGFLVDRVFEPLMRHVSGDSILVRIFGQGKGTGAAVLYFVIGILGVGVCLFFRQFKHMWKLDEINTVME